MSILKMSSNNVSMQKDVENIPMFKVKTKNSPPTDPAKFKWGEILGGEVFAR